MPRHNSSSQPNIGPFTARQVYDSLPLPLSSKCIRMLDVHKSVPADNNRLTGTLRTVDLQILPKFTALSYVWGQGSSHKIACNGCDINISQSCYEALTSLRDSCRSLTIWVDAICINQENNSEKEQQIVLMGSIFTLAETVYVWLGVGSTETDQAAEYICTISQFRQFPARVPRSPRSNTPRNIFRRFIRIGGYVLPLAFRTWCIESLVAERDHRTKFIWFGPVLLYLKFIYADRLEQLSGLPFTSQDTINRLLDQTWLSRAWTFHEMALASNPVLVCGSQKIPWLVMHQALTFIEHSATRELVDPVNNVITVIQHRVHEKVSRSDAFKKWQALFDVWQTIPRHPRRSSNWLIAVQGSSCSVHDCVQALGTTKILSLICHPALRPQNYFVAIAQAIRDRNSKWPHDRVYAIDSVLRQLGARPPTPDYQKPLGRVYCDSLVSLMEWNPTLITLLVDCGSRIPDAPSWVPDWSQNNKTWLPDSYIYHGVEKRSLSVKAASLGMSCYCLTLEKGEDGELTSNEMTTNGKLVRNVQLMAEWALRIRKDTLVFRLHDSIPWTIMLTLTGRSIPRYEVTSEQEDTFRRMIEIITQLGIEVDRVPGDTAAVAAAATMALEAISRSEGCCKLFLDTCNRIAGRRGLLVLDSGMIGSGPISIKQGDTISIIKGIPVPMALRKVGEDYQVLGPVFIDGFMGLPTENLQRMNLEWEIFRLV
ncbi:het-domain-containing protein [Fusarium mundagurra]|uniref:Het-domain-containing protein n=1 Tax=Fusarium mundagurra TaxID=1567541 RepID=A0A8H5YU53_9HYPO|nr:het-domain-containing protein [Fusarium mundagurra]